MKYEDVLDETLKSMLNRSLYNIAGDDDTYNSLLKKISVEDEDFIDILDTLQDDKLAYYVTTKDIDPRNIRLFVSASITPKGKFFIKNGGYSGKLANDRAKEDLARRNEKYLRYGAIWAAVGTIALLLWDMLKYFCEKCQGCCIDCL